MSENEYNIKRLSELSNRAYQNGYCTFSEFLNLDEISEVSKLSFDTNYTLYGGYKNAERCVIGFGDYADDYLFPICCIKIEPAQQKFADKLNHRDFLGSLMNLGIKRNTLGDIIIENNIGYLFCLNSISEYIIQNVKRIKHTTVKCEILDSTPEFVNKLPDSEEIITSSFRVDAIISAIFKLSRNQATQLINQEKVFINSKVAYKESLILKENDVVAVRGFGKFIFCKPLRETKKGRNIVEVRIYK